MVSVGVIEGGKKKLRLGSHCDLCMGFFIPVFELMVRNYRTTESACSVDTYCVGDSYSPTPLSSSCAKLRSGKMKEVEAPRLSAPGKNVPSS
jgi:hypothetical protein